MIEEDNKQEKEVVNEKETTTDFVQDNEVKTINKSEEEEIESSSTDEDNPFIEQAKRAMELVQKKIEFKKWQKEQIKGSEEVQNGKE